MRSLWLVVVAALLALSVAAPLAQGAKPSGAASPEEAVAILQKATAAGDMLQALPVISPGGLKQIADEGVTGLLMVLAFSDPDDPMPGGPKPTNAELAAKRKQYKQAVDLAMQTMKPYGLDTLFVYHYGQEQSWMRSKAPARRYRLKVRNVAHDVVFHYALDDGPWVMHDWWREVSGYHHNVFSGWLALRIALFAIGSGEVRWRNFRYRGLPG